MNLLQLVMDHPLIVAAGFGYVASAAVTALPDPELVKDVPMRQLVYQWLFVFTHTLLNNIEAAMRAKYPQANFGLKKS